MWNFLIKYPQQFADFKQENIMKDDKKWQNIKVFIVFYSSNLYFCILHKCAASDNYCVCILILYIVQLSKKKVNNYMKKYFLLKKGKRNKYFLLLIIELIFTSCQIISIMSSKRVLLINIVLWYISFMIYNLHCLLIINIVLI